MESIKYKVVKSYTSPYSESIPFQKGEYVQVGHAFQGNPEWEGWFRCRGQNEQEAWVLGQFLHINEETGCLNRDYAAGELSVEPGEVLRVSGIINGFVLVKKSADSRGWVPLNHLEYINESER